MSRPTTTPNKNNNQNHERSLAVKNLPPGPVKGGGDIGLTKGGAAGEVSGIMKNMNWTSITQIRFGLVIAAAGLGVALAGCGSPQAQSLNNAPQVEVQSGAEELGALGNGVNVVVNSPRNVVLLPGGRRWTGRLRGTRDVMLIKDGQIMSATGVPESIRQTCDLQISFEQDKIAYFYLKTLQGGSFQRR